MMVAGAATKAYGASQQAAAQQASANYQSQVMANNAIIAQDQATVAENNGQVAAMNHDLQTAQTFGAQRAAFGANGVDMSQGSALNTLATTQFMGQRDSATIMDNAMRQAWGYKTQAADYASNATAEKEIASSISSTAAVGTSLLGSATQANSAWQTYSSANGNPNFWGTVKGWFS
ncbi:hypothetical protein EAY64_05575 [Aquitalea palustris]|uniref:Uncharacterized protein n=1 Tax=Aquitalea palustris TaxID=2480983 RepID=A0A454JKZ6_9NEIS|nr:hypothetical protein [Aquitalea palustris]RMD00067.1 hypothetical protein EAY64_05575 [Aquitalea palustris]